MIVLAADTSSAKGSLALSKAGTTFSVSWEKERSHSDIITLKLEELLNQSKCSLQDIDHYLCGIGPGSFTGIRVGLNLIRTLAYANQKPCSGINSLKVLAYKAIQLHQKPLEVLSTIFAFRNLIYCQRFSFDGNQLTELTEAKALTLEELNLEYSDIEYFTGNAHKFFKDQLFAESPNKPKEVGEYLPSALALLEFFLKHQDSFTTINWKQLKAIYIRGSEAEEKLNSGLLKPVHKL